MRNTWSIFLNGRFSSALFQAGFFSSQLLLLEVKPTKVGEIPKTVPPEFLSNCPLSVSRNLSKWPCNFSYQLLAPVASASDKVISAVIICLLLFSPDYRVFLPQWPQLFDFYQLSFIKNKLVIVSTLSVVEREEGLGDISAGGPGVFCSIWLWCIPAGLYISSLRG